MDIGRSGNRFLFSARGWTKGLASAVGAVLLGFAPAGAGPLDGLSSDNVEFIANIPFSHGAFPSATGARRIGPYLYVRGVESMEIFDVSEPAAPELLGGVTPSPGLPIPSSVEDPDTNGRIFLMSVCCDTLGAPLGAGELIVVDVTDKRSPEVLATLPGAAAHTYTCVLGCRWALGGGPSGHIIDLRDPAHPKLLEEKWNAGLQFSNAPPYAATEAHDVTEVAPGRVLTASTPMYLLDVRKDIAHPRVLATSDGSPHSFGGTAWPGGVGGRFALSWSEAVQAPRCEIRDAQRGTSFDTAFKTWDVTQWRQTGLIFGRDEFYVQNGTHTDGEPVFSGGPPFIAGCSASWFGVHPDFDDDGGLVALGATGHGTKILDIDRNGQIKQLGWFLPHYGNAVAAYWITEEIVYVMDAYRGIDILRVTGES